MKQVIDWLNANELRAYPLVNTSSRPEEFKDSFILDLQLNTQDIDIGSSVVYLTRVVSYPSGEVAVSFGTQTKQIASFLIPGGEKIYPLYLRNPDGNLAVFGSGVTDYINSTSTIKTKDYLMPVEPSVCFQLDAMWLGVDGFNISPEKITEPSGNSPKLPLQNATTLSYTQGDVVLQEGYNFRVNAAKGVIDLAVGTNYGMKMGCNTNFLDPAQCDCDTVVSTINGVPPDVAGNFRLVAGTDIVITSGTSVSTQFQDAFNETSNNNTIFVGFSFQANDLCAPLNITPTLL
jgi:hypothetical protein